MSKYTFLAFVLIKKKKQCYLFLFIYYICTDKDELSINKGITAIYDTLTNL